MMDACQKKALKFLWCVNHFHIWNFVNEYLVKKSFGCVVPRGPFFYRWMAFISTLRLMHQSKKKRFNAFEFAVCDLMKNRKKRIARHRLLFIAFLCKLPILFFMKLVSAFKGIANKKLFPLEFSFSRLCVRFSPFSIKGFQIKIQGADCKCMQT